MGNNLSKRVECFKSPDSNRQDPGVPDKPDSVDEGNIDSRTLTGNSGSAEDGQCSSILGQEAGPMANNNSAIYIMALQGTSIHGGLVEAYKKDSTEGCIKPSGVSPNDESCQFYVHMRVDESTSQNVYRFESVMYKNYNFYWNISSKKVDLQVCDGSDDYLASIKNIWWIIKSCSSECANYTGSAYLFVPFGQPDEYSPFYLVFDEDNSVLVEQLSSAIKNGQFSLLPGKGLKNRSI